MNDEHIHLIAASVAVIVDSLSRSPVSHPISVPFLALSSHTALGDDHASFSWNRSFSLFLAIFALFPPLSFESHPHYDCHSVAPAVAVYTMYLQIKGHIIETLRIYRMAQKVFVQKLQMEHTDVSKKIT